MKMAKRVKLNLILNLDANRGGPTWHLGSGLIRVMVSVKKLKVAKNWPDM